MGSGPCPPEELPEFLELAGNASSLYEMDLPEEKRELLTIATSNGTVQGQKVDVTLAPPFDAVANRLQIPNGAPYKVTPRTLDPLIKKIADWFKGNPAPRFGRPSTLSVKSSSLGGRDKGEELAG